MVGMDWFIDCGTTPFQGPIAAQKGLSLWTFQICTIIILTIQTRVMLKEFIIIDMFTKPNITHITNNSLNHNNITIIAYKITCMFPMFDFTNTNLFLYNFFHHFLLWSSLYLAFVKNFSCGATWWCDLELKPYSVVWSWTKTQATCNFFIILTMAVRVVEFSNGGYKIRKIFA